MRRTPVICDICGRGVDAGQLSAHELGAHASLLDLKDECESMARPAFFRAMIPGVLAFFILSLLIVILVPVEDQYLLLLGFGPIIASALYGEWLSQKAMTPYETALELEDFHCFLCGAPILRSEFSAHYRNEHPYANRMENILSCSFIAIPLTSAVVSAMILVEYRSFPPMDAVFWSASPGVFAVLILVLLSEYVLLPRIRMNRH